MPSSDIERSGFFNAQLSDGTYDREYEAEDFSKYFRLFYQDGVFINPADQLMVKASSGLTISVKAGNAFIRGHYYELLENTAMEIGASTSPRRIDVVVELDMVNRTIERKLVENVGSGGVIPSLSPPTNTENIRQLKLATIPVPASTSTITDSMITDLRPNETYCGFVDGSVDGISTGDLFQQFTDAFNTWFDGIKGQLTEDAAGNLQEQINELKSNANMLTSGTEITGGQNLDSFRTVGNYFTVSGGSVSNSPFENETEFVMKVEALPHGGEVMQRVYSKDGNEYTRFWSSESWSDWTKISGSGDVFLVTMPQKNIQPGMNTPITYTAQQLGFSGGTLSKDGKRYFVSDVFYMYNNNIYLTNDTTTATGDREGYVSVESVSSSESDVYVRFKKYTYGSQSSLAVYPILKLEPYSI